MFESIDQGVEVDNGVMVLGYVIMRVGLIALGCAPPGKIPPRRASALTYATTLFVAQLGWIALLLAKTSIGVMFSVAGVLILIELAGPVVAERRYGGTPWHPHHVAERHGLLTIITLGEVILGTVAALDAVVRRGMDDGDGTRRARGSRAHLRHVVDVLRDAVRRPAAPLPRALLRVGLWAHTALRVPLAATGASTSPPWPSSTRPTSVWWRSWHRPPCRSRCTCSRCSGSTAC